MKGLVFSLVAVLSLLAGASVPKPVPPPPRGIQLLDAPIDIVPRAKDGVRLLEGWAAGEAKRLPIRFAAASSGDRSQWDYPIRCDLLACGSLVLDVAVSSPALTTFRIYFKSGKAGWYAGAIHLPSAAVGRWARLTLSAETFPRTEGKPLGLGQIDGLRLTFVRPRGKKDFSETVALANLSETTARDDAPLVIVGADAESYAKRAADAVRATGLSATLLDVGELTPATLAHRPFVVLPYNPRLPDSAADMLKAYLAAGGRAVVAACGARADLLAAMGVRRTGAWFKKTEQGPFRLGGILPVGSFAAARVGRVDQASWQTDWLAPLGDGETVATWADEKGTDTGRAALVKTARGYVFGHVFLPEGLPLLTAAVRALCPQETAACAAREAARKAELAAFATAADRWAKSLAGKAGERRLMWCHSPLGLEKDGDWDASVRTLKALGYTDLIANLAWGGGADYPTKVAKTTAVGSKYGDLLGAARDACRKYGVKFHVWLVCWPMARSLDRSYVEELDAQGRLQYNSLGERVAQNETAWLCPSSPENRELLAKMLLECAERGADGIHFDYIRYPGERACYCAKCRARFEAAEGRPCAAWPKDVLAGGVRRAAWQDFRRGNVTALVRRVREEQRARFPGVEVSAAVFRDPVGDRESVAQDWANWLRNDLVDFVCPMNYTWSLTGFEGILNHQKEEVGLDRIYPGIGLTSSAQFPKDGGDALRFSEQVLAVRQAGFAGFTCFNYDPRCVAAMRIAREGVLKP